MHPIALLPVFSAGSPVEFEFSKYVYVPQAIAESRTPFRARFSEAQGVFNEQQRLLSALEEIAFHSCVFFPEGKKRAHVPMIDMGCEKIEPHLPELKKAFSDFGIDRFTVFHSGRSFHIYGHRLLADDHELIRFMGRVLLLNLPRQERVIDERWVGHRLMAGYLTLRWTKNNPHYKSAPVKYGEY